jgi:predicted O-methyltransferase YrrM
MATYLFGRRIDHWKAEFIIHRLREKWFERAHPEAPWFTKDAVRLLEGLLRAEDSGLEWGSGRSTLWFARRTLRLVSVEHNLSWYRKIKSELRRLDLANVDYRLVETEQGIEDRKAREEYVKLGGTLETVVFDYVLVDGIFREECASLAVNLVKPGGLLISDNAQWFLPSESRAVDAVRDYPTALWREFGAKVQHWRRVWTGNAVKDTAIFIKPCS